MAFALPDRWPAPADPQAAARLLDAFAALGPGEARLAARDGPRAMLACLGGNSPYLAGLALREPGVVRTLARLGPEAVRDRAMAALAAATPRAERAVVSAALRTARRQVALATALADLGGLWTLEQVTGALSDLADAALRLAVSHLLHAARADGLRLPPRARGDAREGGGGRDLGPGSGFVVLGMGKLGARELNYSSDVDLVLLYDPAAHPYHDAGERADPSAPPVRGRRRADGVDLGALFSRMARGLVSLMEAREDGGMVFRVDLRLRPDPGASPPALSLPGALAYYEGMGQNWERAAMIKARPVAGDAALGAAFLDAIRPFVWRRHLDFAAIADIAGMKRRIDRHKRPDAPDLSAAGASPADAVGLLLGHDLKLGQGGIREVEFLAQTLQLVWGGRNPTLREPRTVPALHLLAAAGHVPVAVVAALAEAYGVLRGAEHRLQMVADRQTHSLPATRAGFAAFATFMGFADADAMARALLARLRAVHGAFDTLTAAPDTRAAPAAGGTADGAAVPAVSGPVAALDIGEGAEAAAPATLAALAGLGFAQPDAAVEILRGWRAGGPRALRSERARALVARITPALLGALHASVAPGAGAGSASGGPSMDRLLARFDALLCALPAGVQLLSLFERNPALLGRVANVLGAAPSLADHLQAVPAAIEGLLRPDDVDPDPARSLGLQLRDADTMDAALGVAQRFLRGEEFRLACGQLEGRLGPDLVGVARSRLADAVLDALLPRVLAEHRRRYGTVAGGGMAVVALGKAGGREMMAGSDLDLMLVYDHAEDAADSDGPDGEGAPASARRIPVSQYYIRAAHALVAALTSPGREGPLYAVDMRLRPSGSKGPVAVSLAGFRRYHAADAWTWERMALTRARVVAAPPALRDAVEAAIRDALATPPRPVGGAPGAPPGNVLDDAAAMRARLSRELQPSGPWDVKHRRGGLMEVEFVAQALQLAHAARHPAVCRTSTTEALHALAAAGALDAADAAALVRADLAWRGVQGLLRIAVGARLPDTLPGPALALLAASLGVEDTEAALHARFAALGEEVRAVFERTVGAVGG
ncbi:MAG: bifunctional [glutamine synthetase] adenylyltransferase/[glutamine synthetase]-adenylyl-L-tyrosine phosphorylase [Janthinobacterium lividum]